MACTAEGARAARPETKPRARGGFEVTTIDFRTDPVTARRHRVVSLVTHADIPDIVSADDETGCYAGWGKDAKGNRIVVERSGPIRIVSAKEVTIPDREITGFGERTIGCRRMQGYAN